MSEFKHDMYRIVILDLSAKTFPYTKILQTKFNVGYKVSKLFKSDIIKYLKKLDYENIDINKINVDILAIKYRYKTIYSEDFPQEGWYDLKVWRELEGNEDILEDHEILKAIMKERFKG